MKRIFVFVIFLFFVFHPSLGMAKDKADIGFQESWAKPQVDLHPYTEIFVYGIDLRGLKVKMTDSDDAVTFKPIARETMEDIASQMNKRFVEQLKKVMPVSEKENETDTAPKGEKVLAVTFLLSGSFSVEELRPLMSIIAKRKTITKPATLTFECRIADAESNKEILRLSAAQDFIAEVADQPFSAQSDWDQLNEILDLWSRRLAKYLESQKADAAAPKVEK